MPEALEYRLGAWGKGSFDNDSALDWVYELEESSDLSAIQSALMMESDYLEVDEGAAILAASEVLLALAGRPRTGLPESVLQWAGQNSSLDPSTLKSAAANGIMRVLSKDSELNGLWEETDEYESWKADVEMLLGAIDTI